MNSSSFKWLQYFTSQEALASELKRVIDIYFEGEIVTEEMENAVSSIINSNKDKFYLDNEVAFKVKKILGKKRLSIIEKIL